MITARPRFHIGKLPEDLEERRRWLQELSKRIQREVDKTVAEAKTEEAKKLQNR